MGLPKMVIETVYQCLIREIWEQVRETDRADQIAPLVDLGLGSSRRLQDWWVEYMKKKDPKKFANLERLYGRKFAQSAAPGEIVELAAPEDGN